MRAAVLDLGSNSFHILIAEAGDDGSISPVVREREMLHLGAIVTEHGHIPEEHILRAVEVVTHFADLARRTGADPLLPIATSALRDATNGPEVVARLSAAMGAEVRTIDGMTEASFGYHGVRASVVPKGDPLLVLDLGGGSLEFSIGEGDEVTWATSLPLGVGRIAAEAVRNDPLTDGDRARIRARVDEALLPVLDELTGREINDVVAVGGTVRALARVIAADLSDWLPASLNMFRVPAVRFGQWAERLAVMDLDQRMAVEAMKESRADHLHIAALIIAAVLDRVGIADLMVSDWGMREGALRETFGLPIPSSGRDLRDQAVGRLRRLFVSDDRSAHFDHVAKLSVQIFDQTHELHGLGEEDRELLHDAAMLHDIGEAIALRGHHKHSAYLLENSEIRGFSPGEVGVLCTLARFHKSKGIAPSFPPYASLRGDRQQRVTKLLPLLQLADGLDRARDQNVHDVNMKILDGVVEVRLRGEDLHTAPGEVLRKADLFERTFGVEVRLIDLAAETLQDGAA